MVINRDIYLNRLIASKHNGLIKIITGLRRCGKSYLLFKLFKEHLRNVGVDDNLTISILICKIQFFSIDGELKIAAC